MSKRNGYKIVLEDPHKVDEIVSDLEDTEIVVEVDEPTFDGEKTKIKAEDAPRAGEAFLDRTKNPSTYIYFRTIETVLESHTDSITKLVHIFSDDTACVTEITHYKTEDGTFIQTEKEERGGANAVRF